MEEQVQATHVKYLIVGAGPGGLQMAYFLERAGLDYLVLEKAPTAGEFFRTQPVHRKLISINKKHNYFEEEEFNWRHDWNSLLSDDPSVRLTEYSDDLFPHADRLYEYLQDFAKTFHLKIAYDQEVAHIERTSDAGFTVCTQKQKYSCQVLLIATGAAVPAVPEDLPGVEHTVEYSKQSTELSDYVNKRVCVIGQGNAAFETAENISGVAAHVHVFAKRPIKFAWETHFVGDVRAINNNVFDMYQLKSLHAVLTPRLRKIEKLESGCLRTHHEYDYPQAETPGTLELTREYDTIILATGWRWIDEELFAESVRPETWHRGKFPVLDHKWASKNVPGLYFVGGAMQGNDRSAASGFIHGYRYNIRTLSRLLAEEYEQTRYPSSQLKLSSKLDELLDYLYQRVSVSAALFQLFGVLCDAVVFSEDLSSAEVFQELPLRLAEERFDESDHVLFVTLEFGFKNYKESSLTFLGPSDPTNTKCAAFLHPVIRHQHRGVMSEFHFGDSLLARWDRPHGEGGAVMSYHYAFQRWLEDQLGCELELPEPTEGGPYRKWTAEEIARWQEEDKLRQDDLS